MKVIKIIYAILVLACLIAIVSASIDSAISDRQTKKYLEQIDDNARTYQEWILRVTNPAVGLK